MTIQTPSGITIRRAADRFHSNLGWLNSHHTFSFGDHYDPAFAGFESLRVINDDTVAPKMGFGEHPHRDMEIISYVISGELEHRDSMGNGRIIKAGDFQYMSAGSGVRHSEFNPSVSDPVHFLQIWITPKEKGLPPRYEEKSIIENHVENGLTLVASPDGRNDSITIRQDASLSFGSLQQGRSLEATDSEGTFWLHVISGELNLGHEKLTNGDGVAIRGPLPKITAITQAEFLLFTL